MVTQTTETELFINKDGYIRVKEIPVFTDDSGQKHYGLPHSRVIPPGRDVSPETQEIRDIAAVVHTPERVSRAQSRRNANAGPTP